MRKFVVSALSALALAAAIQPASAEEVTVKVAYTDLDLASPAGVTALKARVATAVKAACARPDTMRDLKAMADWQHCIDRATAQAANKVAEKVQLASL
jgi:UrcA family protein